MARIPLTVIILTYNEEIHLKRCLENVSGWADEVIVVDSFSSDKTLDIAGEYGARMYQHKFENQAKQFNWALDNLDIKNEWIFRLDADEYLTEELKKEIEEILKKSPSKISGFLIKRRAYFMGRWIRHGGYYPAWILRLFRKEKARSEEREMDEHIIVLEGKVGRLKNDFIDDNKKPLKDWLQKHINYAEREASFFVSARKGKSERQEKRRKFYYKFPIFLRALIYWKYRYFLRLGFLDGKEGLIFHFLQGFWYRFLVDAKIYEIKRKNKNL